MTEVKPSKQGPREFARNYSTPASPSEVAHRWDRETWISKLVFGQHLHLHCTLHWTALHCTALHSKVIRSCAARQGRAVQNGRCLAHNTRSLVSMPACTATLTTQHSLNVFRFCLVLLFSCSLVRLCFDDRPSPRCSPLCVERKLALFCRERFSFLCSS